MWVALSCLAWAASGVSATTPGIGWPRSAATSLAERACGATLPGELAALGAHVVIVGRNEQKLATVREEIAEDGGKASAIVCDIRDEAAVIAKFGVTPAQMLDYLSLVGDTSDNVIGAKGIGESGTIGSTPAVPSAVVDALSHLGVRHIDIPCTAERVWVAVRDAEAGNPASPWREPPGIFDNLTAPKSRADAEAVDI